MRDAGRLGGAVGRTPVVRVENMTVGYATDSPVLRDVSLTVHAGDVVGVAGSTGSGKSTLLYALCGIIPQYLSGHVSGSVELLGETVTAEAFPTLMTGVGFVFQDPDSQLFNLLVRDELVWGLENRGLPRAVMRERLDATAEFLQLEDLLSRITYDLSGGEKQRVALGAAHIAQPRLFLMDDPTSQLDPVGSSAVLQGVRALADQGQTIVLVEQKLDSLLTVVDRLVILGDGGVLFDGPTDEVLDNPGVFARAGMKPPELVSLRAELAERGVAAPRSVHVSDWVAEVPGTGYLSVAEAPASEATDAGKTFDRVAMTVSGLSFRYPPPRDVPVLTDVDLTVPGGAVVALLGRNGSGKTTLARCMSGHLKTKEGRIEVDGHAISRMSMRERTAAVGYVFQNPRNQVFKYPVLDDVAFGPRNLGWPDEEVIARSNEVLDRMGLRDKAELHPYELSKGDLQRLAVAGVLVMEPQVLIVDEPTTGQDPNRAIELVDELCDWTVRQGRTLMIITHAMDLVTRFADQTVVMKEGRVAYTGSPGELFSAADGLLDDLYLSAPPIYQLTKRWRWLTPVGTVGDALRAFDSAGAGRDVVP